MEQSVNVLVSDVPGATGTLCMQVGHVSTGVRADLLTSVLSHRTGLHRDSFRLRSGGRVVCGALVAPPGQRDAYVALQLCRALPGGKGGFGANLRGSAATKKTSNFAACRDLAGRRLRDVHRAAAARNLPIKRSRSPSPKPPLHEPEEVAEAAEDIEDTMRENEDDIDEDLRVGRTAARRARKKRKFKPPVPVRDDDIVITDVAPSD